MKVLFARFHATITFKDLGSKNSINSTDVDSLTATDGGVKVTLKKGARYFVPYANVPYVELAPEAEESAPKKK